MKGGKAHQGLLPTDLLRRLGQLLTKTSLVVLATMLATSASAALKVATLPEQISTETNVTVQLLASLSSDENVEQCQIELADKIDAQFNYQQTNPADNVRRGLQNIPVRISANTTQTFVMDLTVYELVDTKFINLEFICNRSSNGEKVKVRKKLPVSVLPLDLRNQPIEQLSACVEISPERLMQSYPIVMVVQFTDANFEQFGGPYSGRMEANFKIEEVIRGDSAYAPYMESNLPGWKSGEASLPIGQRYLVFALQKPVQWHRCNPHKPITNNDKGDCLIYRYRQLAEKTQPAREICEVESIKASLGRLRASWYGRTPEQERLESELTYMKRIWLRATGDAWDGGPVPDYILNRPPYTTTTYIPADES